LLFINRIKILVESGINQNCELRNRLAYKIRGHQLLRDALKVNNKYTDRYLKSHKSDHAGGGISEFKAIELSFIADLYKAMGMGFALIIAIVLMEMSLFSLIHRK